MTATSSKKALTLDLSNIEIGSHLLIGRKADCDLVIDDSDVSGQHLRISLTSHGAFIRDLQSRKGASVNGKKIKGITRLNHLDKIKILRHVFLVKLPEALCISGCSILLNNISFCVKKSNKRKNILQNITMNIHPGEFIGIVGPSGCGKSTLMNIVTGSSGQSNGEIYINNHHGKKSLLKEKVGYLPQSVITHDRLTCSEILNYARKLHHGAGNPALAISQAGLTEQSQQLVNSLSGGQQKRVGLAQELLFSPELLCLDEVTSGLDPLSEQEMMVLFRELCDRGKTIMCITHNPERLVLCDKLAVLLGGKLIFFGTPTETMKHFSIDSLEQLYSKLSQHSFAHWMKSTNTPQISIDKPQPEIKEHNSTGFAPARQLIPLIRRNFKLWMRSPGELAFLLLQGLAIGILIGLCFGGKPENITSGELCSRSNQLIFSLVLSAIWIGATSAVREIVKERKILIHEGRKRLSVIACVVSKLMTLSVISCFSTITIAAIVTKWTGLEAKTASLMFTLLVTTITSTALGLLVSGLSSSQEKALTALPILIIGLVMFSGGIYELKGFSKKVAKHCSYSYWALNAAQHSLPDKILKTKVPVIPKQPGRRIRMHRVMKTPENRKLSIFLTIMFGVCFSVIAAIGVKYTISKGR